MVTERIRTAVCVVPTDLTYAQSSAGEVAMGVAPVAARQDSDDCLVVVESSRIASTGPGRAALTSPEART